MENTKKTGRRPIYGEKMIYVTHYIPEGAKIIINEMIKETLKAYQERKLKIAIEKDKALRHLLNEKNLLP